MLIYVCRCVMMCVYTLYIVLFPIGSYNHRLNMVSHIDYCFVFHHFIYMSICQTMFHMSIVDVTSYMYDCCGGFCWFLLSITSAGYAAVIIRVNTRSSP